MAYHFWWWGRDDSGSRQLVGIRRHFHQVSIVAPTIPEGMGHMAGDLKVEKVYVEFRVGLA